MSENKKISIEFASCIDDICDVNTSFAKGTLRVAYTGLNRNNSFISKETYERCMDTIYYCPIVCNYMREDNEIGSHDSEIVSSASGMKLVNITQPVGLVPRESKPYWLEIDDNGTMHEYLCIDVLLWKRQEAFEKIKENGITKESMEIDVFDGGMTNDGYYLINSFQFTAFCLLGTAEPCFESAALKVFSIDEFSVDMSAMLKEYKKCFAAQEGGVGLEDNKDFTAQPVNDDSSSEGTFKCKDDEEDKKKCSEDESAEDEDYKCGDKKKHSDDPEDDDEEEEKDPEDDDYKCGGGSNKKKKCSLTSDTDFALSSQIVEVIRDVLSVERVECEWGSCPKYCYVDYDIDRMEVYCYDTEDWKLYGFTFSMNGDSVTIDFASKKRKKFDIVDFVDGSADFALDMSPVFDAMKTVITDLTEYKNKRISEDEKFARENVISKFGDLSGNEAFDSLCEHCGEYSAETLEEKCYAIRGRISTAKFSVESKPPKLSVVKLDNVNDPYGDLFTKYGTKNKEDN